MYFFVFFVFVFAILRIEKGFYERVNVMEKSSILEREIVYLITCFFMLSLGYRLVFIEKSSYFRSIFEIFIVMEKSSICDWKLICTLARVGQKFGKSFFRRGVAVPTPNPTQPT